MSAIEIHLNIETQGAVSGYNEPNTREGEHEAQANLALEYVRDTECRLTLSYVRFISMGTCNV